jgi:hypothetical protein
VTDKVDLKLCILWEGELRIAARSLKEMIEADGTDAFQSKARDALNACITALHGLTDDALAVMIAADALRIPQKARRK